MPSGRPSGGKNKCWTKEEKEEIVLYHLNNDIGMNKCAKHFGVSKGQVFKWVTDYRKNGIEGLINKKKPGNPLSKFSNKKNLTKEEQLEYENMKLRIENELLKKGFLMKGDGTIVKFTK